MDNTQSAMDKVPDARPGRVSWGELQIGVGQVAAAHSALREALAETGLGGNELNSIFTARTQVTCPGCGSVLSGPDLEQIAGSTADSVLPAKLERVRLGACPRNGCNSRFLKLQVARQPSLDLDKVLARVEGIISGQGTLPAPVMPKSRAPIQLRRLVLISLGTLLICFVAYRAIFFRTQPIPFVKPTSPYTVDPKSVEGPSQR
jgi:hypothetical protein